MSLSILFDMSETSQTTLSKPPPIHNSKWREYCILVPLLSERHGVVISLLKEEVGDLTQSYDTDIEQSFLDDVFLKGARYVGALDRDLRGLAETGGGHQVENYMFALTLLRENLDGTIRFYFRIRGRT